MIIFTTSRMTVRRARKSEIDIDALFRMWNSPDVMRNVGFPEGLAISRDEIAQKLEKEPASFENAILLVERSDGNLIGQCKIGKPDKSGISDFDVKLLSEYWGLGYGMEILQGLISHTFTHTAAKFVRGTPNRENTASIRMQERCGLKLSGEGVYEFPAGMRQRTQPVHYLTYLMSRKEWETIQSGKI